MSAIFVIIQCVSFTSVSSESSKRYKQPEARNVLIKVYNKILIKRCGGGGGKQTTSISHTIMWHPALPERKS